MALLDVEPAKNPAPRELLNRAHDLTVELEELDHELARESCRQDLAALVDGKHEALEAKIASTREQLGGVKARLKRFGSVNIRREF